MPSILGDIGTRATPQMERTPGRSDEVRNSAGGFVHELDDWARLERFLILGVDGGTYYVGARDLALDSAEVVGRCLDADHVRAIDAAVAVSVAGRAPSNDPALFVLACGASHASEAVRLYALSKLNAVARIGTHLFHFVRFAQSRRGWGPMLSKAVARWYTSKPVDSLALQVVKYRQRDGWSHRDVLRKAHPATTDAALNAVLRFAAGHPVDEAPRTIEGFVRLQDAADEDEAAELVREYGLPWETVPSGLLAGDRVWRALVETPGALPLGALLRNLGVLTNRGVITARSGDIATRLADEDAIRKARIHPVGVLNAMVTYAAGSSRGGVSWSPAPVISDALDAAFYSAFGNVTPTGKRTMLALDVSGSMSWAACNGSAFNAAQGSTAMAMVTLAVERDCMVLGFSHELVPLDVSPRRRLDDNLATIARVRMGATDCALPMVHAAANRMDVDTFIVYTDNETWAGNVKPAQALARYRQQSGIDAKLIVVGMTSTGFTIADPNDPGMLDVVGFDASAPEVMSEFARA